MEEEEEAIGDREEKSGGFGVGGERRVIWGRDWSVGVGMRRGGSRVWSGQVLMSCNCDFAVDGMEHVFCVRISIYFF